MAEVEEQIEFRAKVWQSIKDQLALPEQDEVASVVGLELIEENEVSMSCTRGG